MEEEMLHKIDRYLEGKLSPEEVKDFEEAFNVDGPLKQQLQLHLKAKAAAYISGRNAQQEIFSKRYDSLMLARQNNKSKIRLYIGIAASIFVLAVSSIFWLSQNKAHTPKDLYASYYQKPMAFETRSLDLKSILKRAHLNFNQNNYTQAIDQYLELLQNPKFTSIQEASFFLAISYLQNKQTDKAISTLATISGNEYKEMAQWYTALAYLENNDPIASQAILEQIAKSKRHHYLERAQELLSKLSE